MGSEAFVINSAPSTKFDAKKMSLDQFMKEAGGDKLNDLFSRVKTGSYTACHVAFYEATGVWIPELVPVFQKMDAMTVMGKEVHPQELR